MKKELPKNILEKLTSKKWADFLDELVNDESMSPLWQELNRLDEAGIRFNPDRVNMFAAFRECDFDNLEVVILGQDPYPDPKHAVGLAFSIPEGVKLPASLRAIRKEVRDEFLTDRENAELLMYAAGDSGDLTHWASQGVLLLNTALTVEAGNAGSHLEFWKEFTEQLIKKLATKHPNCVNLVWLLWGKKAQVYESNIPIGSVFHAAHPAYEAYSGGKGGFYGCGHFKTANDILSKQGKQSISWTF